MRRALLPFTFVFMALVAACGGGGGSSPAPEPAPAPPPPDTGPTASEIALARPISPLLLCSNGMFKRFEAVSEDRFVEVGADLGIDHLHRIASDVWMRESASLESAMRIGAAAAIHSNEDCWPDLIFTSGETESGQLVHYENGSGRSFRRSLLDFPPIPNPVAALGIADLDGDYRFDLSLGNLLDGDASFHLAAADGGYRLAQTLSMPRSTFGFAFGDYSGDQWLDAFAAHWDVVPSSTTAPAVLRHLGAGSGPAAGILVVADSDAGTTPDLLSQEFSFSPAFADLDADGRSDLLIAADSGASEVLLNTGVESFSVVTSNVGLSDENGSGHALQDFDNDGHWDWFVASVHAPADARAWPWGLEGSKLYWGDSEFPYLTAASAGTGIEDAEWPWGVCAQDFNNDGLVDLFVENGFGFAPDEVATALSDHPFLQQVRESLFDKQFSRARLFINQGNRTFVDRSEAWGLTALTNGRGVACLDYDRDGDIDIAVAQNSGPALVYENRHSAAGGNHFVSIRLVSVPPNTQAVGAVVTVEAGGITQMRQVSANSNFLGQDAYDLHFGLSSVSVIERLTVRWPGGRTTSYADVSANRFLTLLDPQLLPYLDTARLARIDAAIASTLRYVASPTQLAEDMLLGLSWMERMHGFALGYSPGALLSMRAEQYQSEGRSREAAQLRAWRGSYDPNYRITASDYDRLSGFDAVTFAGVYCHQHPLDDDYVQALTELDAQGGYSTTHVLLALLWAIDNDCLMPPSYDPQLLSKVIRSVHAIAENSGATEATDLRIEAMAFLAAAGRHDLIQGAWVDQVLDAQRSNGTWSARPGDDAAFDHTTGLALWLLLQLAEPAKVLTGFVAQPWDGV